MSLEGRSIVSIDDLSDSEIERILEVAEEFDECLKKQSKLDLLRDRKLFGLFYEPSSRTYFSFREAMRRLGGDWDGVLNAQSNASVAKGESIGDTIRTFELMADVLVMRHPDDGSARLAAQYTSKPLINGGDGAHEHPTQTLLDLYTIRKEKGEIKGQVVALWGDLLHARTVHSLAYALARFGAKIRTISPPDLGLPTYVRARLHHLRCDLEEHVKDAEDVLREGSDVVYRVESAENGSSFKKRKGTQQQFGALEDFLRQLSALYVTRLQTERFDDSEKIDSKEVEVITARLLQSAPSDTIIMHPLPRRDEIEYAVDKDIRAAYFRQMQNAIPVRMSILALIMGAKDSSGTRTKRSTPQYVTVPAGTNCTNPRCVVNNEKGVVKRFFGDQSSPRLVRCTYCDIEIPIGTVWTSPQLAEAEAAQAPISVLAKS